MLLEGEFSPIWGELIQARAAAIEGVRIMGWILPRPVG